MAVFPEEMLECIFAWLEPIRIQTPDGTRFECDDHMQRKTLASICRTSKACHRIAYPYLYRTIHLSGFSSRPRLLTRSLLHNAKLAPEVRTLRVSGRGAWNSGPQDEIESPAGKTFNNTLRALAQPIINSRHLSTGMRNHILEGVQFKLEDCEIACIAILCIHLEALNLSAFRDRCHSALMRVVTEVYGPTSPFRIADWDPSREINEPTADQYDVNEFPLSRIRDVSFNKVPDQDGISIGDPLALLYLPKLETCHANNIKVSRAISSMPQGSSSLRVLSITNLCVEYAHLEKLLRGCPNLHTLLMHDYYEPPDQPDLHVFGAAVGRWGRKLQVLTLAPRAELHFQEQLPLEGICSLPCLHVLSVPVATLFGHHNWSGYPTVQYFLDSVVDRLPISLERLNILSHMGYEEVPDFSPAIMELWMDHRFAKLEKVSFDRLPWTENLLQMSLWDLSDSTTTRVVLKTAV